MADSRRNKHGESSTDETPEPPPATRQYMEPEQLTIPLPPSPPPPAIGYPPAMGYPPGYHQPNNRYDQHYQQQPPDRGPPPNPAASILATMMLFIFFAFIFCAIVLFVSRPMFPVFHVESMAVANFSVSDEQKFTCAWEINLVAENGKFGAQVHFDRIQSFVYFNTEDLLVSNHFDRPTKDVTIKSNEKGTINIKLKTEDYQQSVPAPNKKVIEAMRNERKNGVVSFSLRAFAWSQVQTGMFYTQSKHVQSRIICDDLKVYFEGDTGNGKLNGTSKDCEVDI